MTLSVYVKIWKLSNTNTHNKIHTIKQLQHYTKYICIIILLFEGIFLMIITILFAGIYYPTNTLLEIHLCLNHTPAWGCFLSWDYIPVDMFLYLSHTPICRCFLISCFLISVKWISAIKPILLAGNSLIQATQCERLDNQVPMNLWHLHHDIYVLGKSYVLK